MGVSLEAYYIIDQKEVKQYIIENNIDINDWEQCRIVASHFYEKITGESAENRNLIYIYNTTNYKWYEIDTDEDDEECKPRHFLYEYHQCNYIRDHKLLKNLDYSHELSQCLYQIHRPKNAMDVAKAIREYFPDNEYLNQFADWLEKTAKFCYNYKLSM